jgi:hypothetical protein
MQIGSPSALSPQLQALGSAALGAYQGADDFDFSIGDPEDGASGASGAPGAAGGAASGATLSGSMKSSSLIAVGTIDANGQMVPFSAAQVQGEEAMVSNMRQVSFADSLQNFLTLAQAGSPDGQVATSTYSDQQQFTGDNGLVSASFDTSFSLTSPGGGDPSTPGSTRSITA